MPFFNDLAQLMGDDKNVTLALRKKGKRLFAIVVFATDEQEFPPMTAEGTPKEFETQLIPRLRKEAKGIDGFHVRVEQLRRSLRGKEKQARKQAEKDAGRVSIKQTTATNTKSGAGGTQRSILG